MTRVLVYSHDTYGLGNIRRMLRITEHLVGHVPDLSALVVTGSPMIQSFRIPQQVDYIKLPCVGRDATGASGVRSLDIGYDTTMRMRANMILLAALDYEPDLVIVDKKPLGIEDELAPTLDMLARRPDAPRVALLLRDILDEPERTVPQWERGRYHDAIERYYDSVLVVGEKRVFDVAREYRFPRASRSKVHYCGYVERHSELLPRAQIRQSFGLSESEPLVLVTTGGGADGASLIRSYLEGLREGQHPWHTLLVAGPELAGDERAAITELARQAPRVVCVDFTREMLSCMNAADAVVAMGGYNTVCELLTLRKSCVIVPRVEPVAEQWMRAERMQRLGLLRALHPAALTPASLMDSVAQALRAPVSAAQESFALDGLQRLGDEVTRLLRQRETTLAARKALEEAAGLAPARHWFTDDDASNPWSTSLASLRRSLRLEPLHLGDMPMAGAAARGLA
jgi:predicted glycosyltransferase